MAPLPVVGFGGDDVANAAAGAGVFQETAGKREGGEVHEQELPGFSDGI